VGSGCVCPPARVLGDSEEEARVTLRTIVAEYSGVPVVHVGGGLDGAASAEFRSAVIAACAADCDRVSVDPCDVHYVESVPIGALIEAHGAVSARGGRLAIACATSDIARILRLSGLGHVVPMFDSVDSAVAFLSAYRP
jgi:anti-sigma B factor antagonist